MDTVCIPCFSQQEHGREILLSVAMVTDIFPAVRRDDAHFRPALSDPGRAAVRPVKGAGTRPRESDGADGYRPTGARPAPRMPGAATGSTRGPAIRLRACRVDDEVRNGGVGPRVAEPPSTEAS
ncbi:hypothetical protein EASAB2608_07241 [Streptomyces sp. EAS-AB2608]|uniref:Uncharacterized protein n=1 Tax=Streptomyces bangladeshensis TaxID=295352 RepID=A0ABP5N6F4_9ACTN|nr:hypothetical protein EASAB2608_07241 [Streptomyces sp. EAS-AB2608]